jgi:hypothetical protein
MSAASLATGLSAEQFALVCDLELHANGHLSSRTLRRWRDRLAQFRVDACAAELRQVSGVGSVLSPNASLVLFDRWQALTPEQRCGFAPLCA